MSYAFLIILAIFAILVAAPVLLVAAVREQRRHAAPTRDLHSMLIRLTPPAPVASMYLMANTNTSKQVLTAHTVSDDQIRALARTNLTASQHKDCEMALNARREMLTSIARRLEMHYPTTKERIAARARCAALINARPKRVSRRGKSARSMSSTSTPATGARGRSRP